jgi:hypothetical protein
MAEPELLADFVARFTEWWKAPDPDLLGTILGPDVHLAAPLTEDSYGLAAAEEGSAACWPASPT